MSDIKNKTSKLASFEAFTIYMAEVVVMYSAMPVTQTFQAYKYIFILR